MVRRSFFRTCWFVIVAVSIGPYVGNRTLNRLFGAAMDGHVMSLVGFVTAVACMWAITWLLMKITSR